MRLLLLALILLLPLAGCSAPNAPDASGHSAQVGDRIPDSD